MNAFVFYLALGIASVSGQELPQAVPSQNPEHQSVQPPISAAEISTLRAKAEQGDASAQFSLGKAYEDGNGVPQSDETAAKWYRKAAGQGDGAADNQLGVMYRTGRGVNPDKGEAVRWYRKGAKLGNPKAMFNLGVSYYNGDGVPSDPMTAFAWFLLAQQGGNPAADDAVKRSATEDGSTANAMQQVAAMYEKGEELAPSYSEAAKWYGKAADTSPQAAVKLAAMLAEGKGVPKDYGHAMELCPRAAKTNYGPAEYCVGLLHERGLGVDKNVKEAGRWYLLASRRGNVHALMALGQMHWKGEGVAVDRPEAYYYFYQARTGAPEAKAKAQELLKEMNNDEIKHLEKKLRSARLDPQKVFATMQSPDDARPPETSSHP